MAINKQDSFKYLENTTKTIREIKDDLNTHWERYSTILKDEEAQDKIDKIIDQLFNIIECYQNLFTTENGDTKEKADYALKECIKAGCDFLRPIVVTVQERAANSTTLPTVGSMTEVMRIMSEADEERKTALLLAENDKIEGFDILKKVIMKYEDVEKRSKEIVAGHQRATSLADTQRKKQTWQIVVAVLAIILAILSFFSKELRPLVGLD